MNRERQSKQLIQSYKWQVTALMVVYLYSQFVVAKKTLTDLFYRRNTGQGHRRRLLSPRLWCIINTKQILKFQPFSFPPCLFLLFDLLTLAALSSSHFPLLILAEVFVCMCKHSGRMKPYYQSPRSQLGIYSLILVELEWMAPPAGCSTGCLLVA